MSVIPPCTIQEALYSYFWNDLNTWNVLSNLDGTIRFSSAESAIGQSYPRVTYLLNHTEDEYTTALDTDQPLITMTFDIWTKSGNGYKDARALGELLKNSDGGQGGPPLKSFSGIMASGPLYVQMARIVDQDIMPQSPMDGGEKGVQCISQTWEFSIDYVSPIVGL